MEPSAHSRRDFLRQAGAASIGIAAASVAAGAVAIPPARRAQAASAASDAEKRAATISAGIARIQADHARLADQVADLVRVRFDLAPALLLPGEEVTLTIHARSAARPNAAIEVVDGLYDEAPTARTFDLSWRPDGAGRYTSTWRWRPPRCGTYQVRWKCDVGGDVPEFRRIFSVVDRCWAVMIVNSTSHGNPRPEPDFHALGLPFSYWQEVSLFEPRRTADDFARLSRGARQYGDDPGLMIFMAGEYLPGDQTVFYDEPEAVQRTVLDGYRKVWPLHGFPYAGRGLYTYGMGNTPVRIARSLGYDLLGGLCADQNWGDGPFKINHWGMPARPYFVSRDDFRRPGDGGRGAMVGVQQCERETVECRDYNCVYAFEAGTTYALDMYSGVTRPRTVDDAILSREMDFLECFLDAAAQARTPYMFGCGFEFNGVWPHMAAVNRHFMELLVRRSRGAKLAFTTATAAADFLRRHYDRTPETVLYLPDVFAGITSNGKPALYPDTMEVENDRLKAIFRYGEALPYAQYDYAAPWQYPDWGNADIPRDSRGYPVPDTDDRFRVTPHIVDTRPFTVTSRIDDSPAATRVTLEVDAAEPCRGLALAVWDLPREYSDDLGRFRLAGAQRFLPLRTPYTGNLNGILVADIRKGLNRMTLTVTTARREPQSQQVLLGAAVMAKVFARGGSATAYLHVTGSAPAEFTLTPPAGAAARLYRADSDVPDALTGTTTVRVEPGTCVRLAGLTVAQLLAACPSARIVPRWTIADARRAG